MSKSIKQVRAERRQAKQWGEEAITYLAEWVLRKREVKNGWLFAAEDVIRTIPRSHSLRKAKDNRAWGSIFTAAKRRGIIKEAGFGESLNIRAHSRPVRLYTPGD